MKRSLSFLTIVIAVLLSSCMPQFGEDTPTPTTPADNSTAAIDKLNIPAGFEFNTTADVKFEIGTFDNNDGPIRGIVVSVYSSPENELLFKGITGTNGLLTMTQKIPTYVKKVSLQLSFIGLPSEIVTDVKNNTVNVTFGGKNPKTYGSIDQTNQEPFVGARVSAQDYPPFDYLGTWNNAGVPNYLDPQKDIVTSEFLKTVNQTLPESKSYAAKHPENLVGSNRNYLYVKELADVWITFVHEGASYLNALGYYTFDPNNPPTKIKDISKINIIFPNVSYAGSGGGLALGDRVKIGRFPGGTAIGFVLLANAFDANTKTVGKGLNAIYGHDDFNVESDPLKRRHFIVLNDPATNRFILSFEDRNREQNSDEDFNDAIFYAMSNPVKAFDANGIPLVDNVSDKDGDGVNDYDDEYPEDATKAINNYTPTKNTFSTLAYEDLWPYKGDYDMNDLVVNYQFKEVLNGRNQVVEMDLKAYVKAIGATFACGWGFQMPIAPSDVKSVTGHSLKDGVVSLAANGLEAGQSLATVIAFDNSFKQMKSASGFANTLPGSAYIEPTDTLRMHIAFNAPVEKSILGSAPYNAFIFKTSERGKEIHLINQAPTSKANPALLGTGHDKSSTSEGKYYKTANGMPWALNIYSEFRYPFETKPITDAYNFFSTWSESAGANYPDWYLKKAGYTNEDKIYKPNR
ncbi:LruC domain-containing protein [Emticicia sp. 21SJ11W-3]|uniref:LruC domain-containing protein n=1 Tax=Emticicia sp. 21SJ11W-3 TaxID=2916755 RepID=UPI0020A00CB5|nr:LruC domain-containing protein [Emticicia sp. 21SJ11W-3]UTA69847.1 LruC domain-containing protein [Emticicia sp. 21SJ11W-3]